MAMNRFFKSTAAATIAAGFAFSPMAANAADKIGTAKSFDMRKKGIGAQQKAGPFFSAKFNSVVLMVRGGDEAFVESIRNRFNKLGFFFVFASMLGLVFSMAAFGFGPEIFTEGKRRVVPISLLGPNLKDKARLDNCFGPHWNGNVKKKEKKKKGAPGDCRRFVETKIRDIAKHCYGKIDQKTLVKAQKKWHAAHGGVGKLRLPGKRVCTAQCTGVSTVITTSLHCLNTAENPNELNKDLGRRAIFSVKDSQGKLHKASLDLSSYVVLKPDRKLKKGAASIASVAVRIRFPKGVEPSVVCPAFPLPERAYEDTEYEPQGIKCDFVSALNSDLRGQGPVVTSGEKYKIIYRRPYGFDYSFFMMFDTDTLPGGSGGACSDKKELNSYCADFVQPGTLRAIHQRGFSKKNHAQALTGHALTKLYKFIESQRQLSSH